MGTPAHVLLFAILLRTVTAAARCMYHLQCHRYYVFRALGDAGESLGGNQKVDSRTLITLVGLSSAS